ncbi:fatty acid desaturase [Sorangium sp. So ce315]|uniref:fatty acid desaturase n=1 Tax=Sorangium sp. So ce315 TaxID=3133299 RepID=UPI003F5FEA90
MSVIGAALTSLPFTQFRRNRYFYLYHDGGYALLCATVLSCMLLGGHEPFIGRWDDRLWLLLPLLCHAQILCSVLIHDATHNNFPRQIDRLVDELCGVIVLTRFASWEVIHQRHHRCSDDVERDPHPVVPSYWAFLAKTVVSVARQLQQIYFDKKSREELRRRGTGTSIHVERARNQPPRAPRTPRRER